MKNKKKFLALFIFLFALAGVIGYGVYSYYWTDGTVTSNTEQITISSFNPTFSIDGDHKFIHSENGQITLSCPSTSTGSELVQCTGTVDVYNDGDTYITLSVDTSDSEITSYSQYSSSKGISHSVSSVDYYWSDSTLAPGSSATLTITAYVDIDNGTNYGSGGSEAEYVTSAVEGANIDVTASLKIVATQVH